MVNTAGNVHDHGEFWRPALETRQESVPMAQTESCARCGTEFVAGSRFCHVCGAERAPQLAARRFQWARFPDIHRMRERLGLPLVSMVALVVGTVCALAAIGTGLVFTAATVLDWQAVQIWRIEWLLAAVVAFLAGILLKTAGGPRDKQD
jgi:hypothetical protein